MSKKLTIRFSVFSIILILGGACNIVDGKNTESDCYDITPEIIDNAFAALEDNDIVVGPAEDGGYYLLGMKEYLPQLFEGKTYSTNKVFEELMEVTEDLELSVHQLQVLIDIDTLQDLKDAGVELVQDSDEDLDVDTPPEEEV